MVRTVLPWLPEGLDALAELALDVRWTWTHEGDSLWSALAPDMWEQTQNPWLMLHNISHSHLEERTADPTFQEELTRLTTARKEYMTRTGWFKEAYPEGSLNTVAYFSMEFGLGEALPLYAGGLGVLAGDYLKTASDLQVPLVGVGLLYQEGYFRQMLDADGLQMEAYPYNDPTTLPITPVFAPSGGRLRVPLQLPGRTLWIRAWRVRVGRVDLYLLDTNDPLNSPADRGITNKLYDSRPEIRVMQEMVLGIGGWRVLLALNVNPEICHLNEGHPAFAILERTCDIMDRLKVPFPVALNVTRAGTVFTTHTPVAAGFDVFSADIITRYFHTFLEMSGITLDECLALGRRDPADKTEPFNMAYLAMHGGIKANGVSRLHGRVSRRIFHSLFPRWPQREVPVGHITNGVHAPSWDSQYSDDLWTRVAGKGRWLYTLENIEPKIEALPDKEVWSLRAGQCQCLLDFVRRRLAYQLSLQGAAPERIEEARTVLDPKVLTIGFARRFTDYKRPNLLLTDPNRLAAILNNPRYPVQIVAAGKAHPQDETGKRLVQQFVKFARQPDVRRRVVFLADYDITTAAYLVQGVDLWLNTPRRPWEACGTSGMKVLVNGGLNVSTLDGWWAEAYTPEMGWAIGNSQDQYDPQWDTEEATQLYDLLEREIVPDFYDRNAEGVPLRWVKKMRASMSRLAPQFSSNRMLREYVENMYLPATTLFRQRLANGGQIASELHAWQSNITRYWSGLRFGELGVQTRDDHWVFDVTVHLGDLNPDYVSVELVAEPVGDKETVRIVMKRAEPVPGAPNDHIYRAEAPAERPAEHYTPRLIPANPAASVPLEDSHILWQK